MIQNKISKMIDKEGHNMDDKFNRFVIKKKNLVNRIRMRLRKEEEEKEEEEKLKRKRYLVPGESIKKQKIFFPDPFRPNGRKKTDLIKIAKTLNQSENSPKESKKHNVLDGDPLLKAYQYKQKRKIQDTI